MVVGALLYVVRRLERWLHQHIFKVGWLLTKNLRTTTVLYYTFFLPGVVVNQFVYWMAAGILNVRAERAIAWPESQSIAELDLSFIKLSRNTGPIRIAIISLAPLIAGLALIWLIATNVLDLSGVIALIQQGADPSVILNMLINTPDIWIWVYLMFTIANTMFPDRESLRGWRPILIGVAVVIVLLYVFGVAQTIFLSNLVLPIMNGLNILTLIFTIVIAIDLLVTGVLGGLESIIERITKNSATFQNGKLIAITREEMLKQRRAKAQQTKQPKARPPAGHPSIYKLALPIPGAPGKDIAEPIIVTRDDKTVLPAGAPTTKRVEPQVILGTATIKTDDEIEAKPADRPLQEAHIELPASAVKSLTTSTAQSEVEDDEDEDEVDEDEVEGKGDAKAEESEGEEARP